MFISDPIFNCSVYEDNEVYNLLLSTSPPAATSAQSLKFCAYLKKRKTSSEKNTSACEMFSISSCRREEYWGQIWPWPTSSTKTDLDYFVEVEGPPAPISSGPSKVLVSIENLELILLHRRRDRTKTSSRSKIKTKQPIGLDDNIFSRMPTLKRWFNFLWKGSFFSDASFDENPKNEISRKYTEWQQREDACTGFTLRHPTIMHWSVTKIP